MYKKHFFVYKNKRLYAVILMVQNAKNYEQFCVWAHLAQILCIGVHTLCEGVSNKNAKMCAEMRRMYEKENIITFNDILHDVFFDILWERRENR